MKKFTITLALFASAIGFSQNIITNGDFSGGLTNWSNFVASWIPVTANFDATNNEANITGISGAAGDTWHVQLNQELSPAQVSSLTTGQQYKISFDARGASARPLKMFFGENGGGFVAVREASYTLTTTMTTYTASFMLIQTYGAMKLGFEGGTSNTDFFIDNVKLELVPSPTAPIVNAPVPTKLQADVVSVFSDSYTNVGTNYNPNWSQSGFAAANVAYNPTGSGSNICLAYTNFNYQGNVLTPANLVSTTMEKLHLDVWTANCASLDVYLVTSLNGERKVTVTPTLNGWSSFDILLSDYSAQGIPLTSIKELKYVSASPATSAIYIDNVYFWKEPSPTGTPVYGTFTVPAKNTGEVDFAITPPTSTSPAPFTYTSGNTAVATIVGGNMIHIVGPGTSVITASQVASAPYIAGSTTANFIVTEIPAVAAPTPPARAAGNVISLFSDAYTDLLGTNWSATWDDSNVTDVTIASNATKKIDFTNFLGVILSNYNDATAMTHFHMDYWIPSATDLTGKVLNPKLSNHANEVGETNALLLTNLPTVKGSWVQLDALLSSFTPQGTGTAFSREKFKEFIITSNLGTVYVDNIYLHNNIVLGTQSFSASKIKMYPNPATNMLNIEALNEIENISVYNLLGQEVISKTTNNKVVNLDIASINSGIYIIKTTIDGVVSASRFVKE